MKSTDGRWVVASPVLTRRLLSLIIPSTTRDEPNTNTAGRIIKAMIPMYGLECPLKISRAKWKMIRPRLTLAMLAPIKLIVLKNVDGNIFLNTRCLLLDVYVIGN